jgi:hypothetical protein
MLWYILDYLFNALANKNILAPGPVCVGFHSFLLNLLTQCAEYKIRDKT